MKNLVAIISMLVTVMATGCAYNGKLKSGFYSAPTHAVSKMPLKADLVCGEFFKSIVIDPGHVYGNYSVHLKTDPALQEALQKSCESLFDTVYVTPAPDSASRLGADIFVLPALQISEHTLTLTLTIKSAKSGETISQYSASNNFEYNAPAGVHILDTLDIFACGALAPIIIPSNTSMIGHRGERILGERLNFCIGQITESIHNDTTLAAKAGAQKF